MTTGIELETVSRETPPLPLALPEEAPGTPANVDALADVPSVKQVLVKNRPKCGIGVAVLKSIL